MMVQQTVFTIHGTDHGINELEDHENYLLSFVVPAEVKSSLRHELRWLGIREMHLFPDLEHLAKDLASVPYAPDGDD